MGSSFWFEAHTGSERNEDDLAHSITFNELDDESTLNYSKTSFKTRSMN